MRKTGSRIASITVAVGPGLLASGCVSTFKEVKPLAGSLFAVLFRNASRIAMLAVMLLAGCAMTKPPLQRDQGYPAEWPDISSLGAECKGLDGTYANQGTVIDRKGIPRTILLTSILLKESPAEVTSISLKVVTKKGRPDQNTFAKLLISFGEQNAKEGKLSDCFCIQHTLSCPNVASSYSGFPYLGLVSYQQSVWLTKATDGSLVAKIWDCTTGVVVVVPFYKQSYVWARFTRIAD